MKAVLISTQPKWVEKIISGKKTIEVRKTKPKLETPFKCCIYCTKSKNEFLTIRTGIEEIGNPAFAMNGKIIGEFVCDRIDELPCGVNQPYWLKEKTCITNEHYKGYLGNKDGYGWHISNLKVYDKPKELSEFYARCNIPESRCKLCDNCYDREDYYGRHYAVKKITRPPQSWQYIEV